MSSSCRYSVCRLHCDEFEDIRELDRESRRALKVFLQLHTHELLMACMDDRFRTFEDAESFANMVYRKDNSGDVIAIYDWLNKEWISSWFM